MPPAREASLAEATAHLLDAGFPPSFGPMYLDEQAVHAFCPVSVAREHLPFGTFDVHLHEACVTAD
jgi:hypothetical protein